VLWKEETERFSLYAFMKLPPMAGAPFRMSTKQLSRRTQKPSKFRAKSFYDEVLYKGDVYVVNPQRYKLFNPANN
jgi:hypothetical protein